MKLNIKKSNGLRYCMIMNKVQVTEYCAKWLRADIQKELKKIVRCRNPEIKRQRQERLNNIYIFGGTARY